MQLVPLQGVRRVLDAISSIFTVATSTATDASALGTRPEPTTTLGSRPVTAVVSSSYDPRGDAGTA